MTHSSHVASQFYQKSRAVDRAKRTHEALHGKAEAEDEKSEEEDDEVDEEDEADNSSGSERSTPRKKPDRRRSL